MSDTAMLIISLIATFACIASLVVVLRTSMKIDEIYFAFQMVLAENKRLRKKRNGSKKQTKK